MSVSFDRNLIQRNFVRLACVKHAASVRPEPGSNSPNIISKPTPAGFNLIQSFCCSFRHLWRFSFYRNYCVRFLFQKLLEIFSGSFYYRCLIFKVQSHSLSRKYRYYNTTKIQCQEKNSEILNFFHVFSLCGGLFAENQYYDFPTWNNTGIF